MKLDGQTVMFSATDLVNYLGCRHAVYLDLRAVAEPAVARADDPFLKLIQEKGLLHERSHLAALKARGHTVVDLRSQAPGRRAERTQAAMRDGTEVIYQAALEDGRWHGIADFLVRVPGGSTLEDFHYEAVDTKLTGAVAPGHALQLSVYSMLLAAAQGRLPAQMHVVVGNGDTVSIPTADVQHYAVIARSGLKAFADAPPAESIGEPCAHCGVCRWSDRCTKEWAELDHLSQVANITRGQRDRLVGAGISTMAGLAAFPESRIAGMSPDTLQAVRSQARLQVAKRADGANHLEVLPVTPAKGFARMPEPNAGDLFFDMEGDPLFDGGLEYLFGFVGGEDGAPRFTAFWGHSRAEEKLAFEQAMDFVDARLSRDPDGYIYHYGSYEESALNRLAMLHGTREAAVDNLLRAGKLVDLYQVVRWYWSRWPRRRPTRCRAAWSSCTAGIA